MDCYLRPLEENDAAVSFHWRNDERVWKHTGSRPDRLITQEIESDWMKAVLKRTNEKRFAICIEPTNEYIGNVQLTSITSSSAELHIFIGNVDFWGNKLGQKATESLLNIAFEKLNLKEVYLYVQVENKAAIAIYKKCGFNTVEENDKDLKMICKSEDKI
jgi:RimJ/RimL family protein N-acetyltransferase